MPPFHVLKSLPDQIGKLQSIRIDLKTYFEKSQFMTSSKWKFSLLHKIADFMIELDIFVIDYLF